MSTDPALRAADPATSVWVAANAGSGKTYTLAARVTRLLLAGAPPEKILCLTYTKAAAAEMAGRLFDQLGAWAMLGPEELRAKIAQIGGRADSDDDLRRARRLFAQALETPGGLKIQTIHAFCQHVLMRFPLEAGLPASFTVLDERSAADLIANARTLVLERAGTADPVTAAALALLVTQTSEDTMARLMQSALGADRGRIGAFLKAVPQEERAARLKRLHGAQPEDSESTILAEWDARFTRVKDEWLAAKDWLAGGTKTDIARCEQILAALTASDARIRYDILCDALLTDGALRKRLATKGLVEAAPQNLTFLETEGGALMDFAARIKAVRGAELASATLTIIAAVRDIYAAEKQARGALDYDDLIAATQRLLQGDGAAWVLYKLDEGIDHILIDEAQDTSAAQWDIVQNLTAEFFAGDGARRTGRTLFAVGDEKQSIYSFQGADPKQFSARRAFFASAAAAAGSPFTAVDLPVSRRSAPEVLAFVDGTFAAETARKGLTADGAPVAHTAHRTEAKGRVEFWPVIAAEKADEADPWNLRPLDLAGEGSPLTQLATKIATTIDGWLRHGETLPGKNTPVSPGDIMILLPRREPFASEIIRRLKERGVPVAGADRLRLADQIAVMDLVALGRFALTPDDELTLAALLRSPLIGLSEEALFTLAASREGRLWHALAEQRDAPAFTDAYTFLADVRGRVDNEPPFEFYARTLNDKRAAMLARLGPEADDAMTEFLNLALAYERNATPSLEGFLHWFSRGGAEVKRDMDRGRGEVRVMTVHGAKGLEADIVFLPDTTTVPTLRSDSFLYTEEGPLFPAADKDAAQPVQDAKEARKEAMMEERRRLLYVALTRARERLIICGFENKRGTAEGSWNKLTEAAAAKLCSPQEDIRVFGHPSAPATTAAMAAPARVTIPDWARTHAPEETPAPLLIRPSDVAGEDEPPVKGPARGDPRQIAAKQRGTLAHALFAHLPDISPDERQAAAAHFLAAHGMEATEASPLISDVLAVLNAPDFAAAFAPGSRAEVALMAELPELGPGARVHGRIDRLAVSDSHVLIVDFKTNRNPPADESKVPPLYAAQMALYAAAARKIFPNRTVCCALVWTEGPVFMPISNGLLDETANRIRARLTLR